MVLFLEKKNKKKIKIQNETIRNRCIKRRLKMAMNVSNVEIYFLNKYFKDDNYSF